MSKWQHDEWKEKIIVQPDIKLYRFKCSAEYYYFVVMIKSCHLMRPGICRVSVMRLSALFSVFAMIFAMSASWNEVLLGLLLNISLLKSFLWMDLSPDGSVFSLFSGKSKIFFLPLVLCHSKNIGKRRIAEIRNSHLVWHRISLGILRHRNPNFVRHSVLKGNPSLTNKMLENPGFLNLRVQ